MATNITFLSRRKQRIDTEKNWKTYNPVLLKGELAFTSDKAGMYKVGDGTSNWSNLSYNSAAISKSDVINALGYEPPEANTWRPMAYDLDTDDNTKSLSADLGPEIKNLIEAKLGKTDISDWAKAATKPTYSWSEISSKPTFAKVATSGRYTDLSNIPSTFTPATHTQAYTANQCNDYTSDDASMGITPAAVKKACTEVFAPGNGTVTIKQAGTQKGLFTLNQSGNTTIELTDTLPDLSGYLKLTGGRLTGTLSSIGGENSSSYNQNFRLHPDKNGWTSIVLCGDDNTGDSGTSEKTWGLFGYGKKFSIARNGTRLHGGSADAYLLCDENSNWEMSGSLGVAGNITAKGSVSIGGGCTLQYDSTNKCVNFVFS